MKRKYKVITLLISLLCLLSSSLLPVFAADGTNGDELQMMQAEQLEIQLGIEWSGVEFQLKTDSGLYPGVIPVGEDGVLRLEIGGSSSYILTCMNSRVAVSDTTQVPATTGNADSRSEDSTSVSNNNNDATVSDIPIIHIILFGGGLLLCITVLLAMRFSRHRMSNESDDDE